ncbi:MAG TPA: adenine nucleotide alpha hydrolase family protein [Desulfurobacteriaceae bacterium]|nr:adenine nucleotide alpha hydrolase family protein [Desulfurobacteriaceae bacterium]
MAKLIRCKFCKNFPYIFLKEYRLYLCKEHFISWIENYVYEAIKEYKMFSHKDKILVCVSGGKDSIALVSILNSLGYKIYPFFIDLGIKNFSKTSLKVVYKVCQILNLPLYIYDIKGCLSYSIKEISKALKRSEFCSICGTLKRYIMEIAARYFKVDVIATGHNLNDETENLFLNVLNWKITYLARQGPVLKEEKGFKKKVKPLFKLREKYLYFYVKAKNLPFVEEKCPYSKGATRYIYRKVLNFLEENMPGCLLRFYLEFLRKAKPIFEKALDQESQKLHPCPKCFYPTSRKDKCLVCSYLEKTQKRFKN